MKYIKQFEMWITNFTSNYSINYNDKKTELSKDIIDMITYIDNNIENINQFDSDGIYFNHYENMEYYSIKLFKKEEYDYMIIKYLDTNDEIVNYQQDITKYEYKYLSDYFLKLYLNDRKKRTQIGKEKHKDELIKKHTDKFNI